MCACSFPAHIRIASDGSETIQTVAEHCKAVAEYAGASVYPAGLYHAGYLAGLMHDMGKARDAFVDYLTRAVHGEPVRRGSVNHTFAGVRMLLEFADLHPESSSSLLCAELLAYAVGAHHGVFDIVSTDGSDGFLHRLQTEGLDYPAVVQNFTKTCAEFDLLDRNFLEASKEIEQIAERLGSICREDESAAGEGDFYLGLLARLLLSAVIEGDRRDTMEFDRGTLPGISDGDAALWQKCLHAVEQKLSTLPHNTPVEKARKKFSDKCSELANCSSGLYRLNLPTGGGKTLASLRGALAHAAAQNKRRIIYVIPLLSVLDQNAAILRSYLDNPNIILEHHSNLIRDKADGELDPQELLAANWQSPVVITTLVQLLNTLYDGRTSCIRRMQALCGSVLIFDEVQSVPPRLLTLFHLAVNFLVTVCDTTVILCSATVPFTEKAAHPYFKEPVDIVPYDAELWKPFHRTQILEPINCKTEEIGKILLEKLSRNLLLVCNTRAEAASVYQQLEGMERYHLSASMCMAHRRKTLSDIESALLSDRPFICISTQVIECGVDVSFHEAVRILAGLDSILQTAGRCNRHGERPDIAEVSVLRCTDEHLTHLTEIRDAQKAAEALFDAYRRNPAVLDGSISSDRSIRFYYGKLFENMRSGAQDGPLKGLPTLYELLSDNEASYDKCKSERPCLCQAFATAGEHFEVFEQCTYDLLVPYERGRNLIADLESPKALYNPNHLLWLLEQAKPYTISIYQYQKEQLAAQGALYEVQGILILREGWYSNDYGLSLNGGTLEFQEV